MPAPKKAEKPDTVRSIYYALAANVAISVVKVGGAIFTGSGALLAEACHSLADTGNEALLLVGRKQAKARPSAHHPLGQGRATYFWSFVVTLMLFTLGGMFSIIEGIQRLRNPQDVSSPWLGVGIVLFAVVAEGISLRMALKQIAKVRGNKSLWRWFRDTRRSELIVVLSEDLTAVIGLGFALVALLLTIATGNTIYDAIGSIAVGTLLVVVATGLAVEIKSLLIGESASPKTLRAMREFLIAQPDVDAIAGLVTLQQGEDLMVAVQAHMDRALDAGDLVRAIARCKAALQEQFPQAAWIFFEPVEGKLPSTKSLAKPARPRRARKTRAVSVQ